MGPAFSGLEPEWHDCEYERCGAYNIFLACEPLAGKRLVKATERKTKLDWAQFLRELDSHYPDAEKVTLVMDNLNTHKPGSRYEALPPAEAKRLWERFEFVYTPRHGSWLHMAEIELNVSIRHNVSAEEWKIWSRLKRPWRLGRIIETTGKPGSTGSSQRRTPA